MWLYADERVQGGSHLTWCWCWSWWWHWAMIICLVHLISRLLASKYTLAHHRKMLLNAISTNGRAAKTNFLKCTNISRTSFSTREQGSTMCNSQIYNSDVEVQRFPNHKMQLPVRTYIEKARDGFCAGAGYKQVSWRHWPLNPAASCGPGEKRLKAKILEFTRDGKQLVCLRSPFKVQHNILAHRVVISLISFRICNSLWQLTFYHYLRLSIVLAKQLGHSCCSS